jgi:hypothetical protein
MWIPPVNGIDLIINRPYAQQIWRTTAPGKGTGTLLFNSASHSLLTSQFLQQVGNISPPMMLVNGIFLVQVNL